MLTSVGSTNLRIHPWSIAAAAVLATLPPEQVGRQVLRVAERVGLDHAEVTRAVTDAVSRDGDAVRRVARRDLRGDLDRGWGRIEPAPAAQLAQASYPQRPSPVPADIARDAMASGMTSQQDNRNLFSRRREVRSSGNGTGHR